MKFLCVLGVLCGLSVHAIALDRNAFTFIKYHLTATVDPDQQRLGVRGRITLRNDSSVPQKNLSLQISSTLDWKSVQLKGKPIEFLTHGYTSDIDHTGELSEAIVTLPREVQPKEIIELDIGYEGTIPLDTTRLTRIGVPDAAARRTDWDQISPALTAVRGIGHVTWYPVATDAASLSEGNSVEETIERWKQRNADSEMSVFFESNAGGTILASGTPAMFPEESVGNDAPKAVANVDMLHMGTDVPAFVIADYRKVTENPSSARTLLNHVYYLQGKQDAAAELNRQIASLSDFVGSFSRGGAGIQVVENPVSGAAPFTSGPLLIMPFGSLSADETKLTLIYALTNAKLHFRPAWAQQGLAHYAQAAYLEQQRGRQSALDYLNAHETELVQSEKTPHDGNSLLNGMDGIYFQSKAMRVWWMLRDMLGTNVNITLLLNDYKFSEDQSANYVQKLIEAKTHRDLQWFFDDWVYHDRGLPDFRVTSVFPSTLPSGGYLVTVTVENLGAAGAEVPITLQIAGGTATQRLKVLGKSKNSIRFEVPATPQQVTVNDGSVPESDMSNNTFVVNK